MNIEHTDTLKTDGDSYAVYNMYGFNVISIIGDGVEDCFQLKDNKPYIYENHPFLYSFSINDEFLRITFCLKAGFDAADYIKEIGLELERICFNLITYKNIHTFQPICVLEKIKTHYSKTTFEESICLKHELKCRTLLPSLSFYKDIVTARNAMMDKNQYQVYKQIFDILQCPNLVIQYMSLYDLLKDKVCNGINKNQKGVVQFFKDNKNRYPEVKFFPSRRKNGNNEDNYTFLRNKIGHPWGLSAKEIKKLGISESLIKSLLSVINDVLCGNCVP